MVVKSLHTAVIPNTPFHDYIFQCLHRHGDAIAMIDNTRKTSITYKEYRDQSIALACGLRKHGVKKKDIVGVVSETCSEYGLICLAIMACGGIPTSCNPAYTKDEILHQFKDSKPKYIFASLKTIETIDEVAKELQFVQDVICIWKCKGHLSISDLVQKSSMADYPYNVEFDIEDDAAFLPYSSGTTGLPKGVVLTHKNLVAASYLCYIGLQVQRNDCTYCVAPSFHMYGFMIHFTILISGSKLVVDARFNLSEMMQSVQQYRVSILITVPPMMVAIVNDKLVNNFDTLSVKAIICAAAPLAHTLAADVEKKMKNAKVMQLYGLSESVPVTIGNTRSGPMISIGSISPNNKVKIVDVKSGQELPVNQDGEICVKGPQTMKGYLNNPIATQNTIDAEGWFHTGDIGHVDENGYFYIVDRLKELIKFKGFQVAPAELEAVLLRHPQIVDAAVIGIPDDVAGELPKAFVVRDDPLLTENEVIHFVKSHVATFKQLKGGVQFMDVIPKSASGKILRRELRTFPSAGKAKL